MIKQDFNLNQFYNFMTDKKCICFGTGLQGLRFINIFENWEMTSHIVAFTDNNPQKWGNEMHYDSFSYPIIPVQEAIKALSQNIILVITCADFVNIEYQLNRENALYNTYCFSLAELGQNQLAASNYTSIIHEYESPIIPKLIHYCWFGNEMPVLIKQNIEKWKLLCPDYEIIEWNETNYNINKNNYTKQAYNMKKWGYVPDYIRLDLVYKYGGIYLDTDVEILKSLDELLYQDGFASFDGSLLMNLGSGFGSKPGGCIIKELRDYYDNINFSYSNGNFDRTSCMTHSYNVLKRHNFNINDSFQKVEDLNIYPMVFQGTNIYTRRKKITDKTFFLHYGTLSWLDKKTSIIIDKIGYSIKSDNLESYI